MSASLENIVVMRVISGNSSAPHRPLCLTPGPRGASFMGLSTEAELPHSAAVPGEDVAETGLENAIQKQNMALQGEHL